MTAFYTRSNIYENFYKGRYALRMMIDLSQHSSDEFVALKDIAERQGISKKYLEQIVPLLNGAGMLSTNRGYQGGYKLARKPKDYTVAEILRVTEESCPRSLSGRRPDKL